MRCELKLELRDLWIGVYWDRDPFRLYVCPLPGVRFAFARSGVIL